MAETALDRAHTAMGAAQDDDALRLAFFERLADAELFLLLAGESDGETADPQIFEVEADKYVLAFDREDRLSDLSGRRRLLLRFRAGALPGCWPGRGLDWR